MGRENEKGREKCFLIEGLIEVNPYSSYLIVSIVMTRRWKVKEEKSAKVTKGALIVTKSGLEVGLSQC